MSGGGKGDTTTTTNLPDWAQPYAKQILEQGSQLSQQDIPQYTGSTVAGLSPEQQQAIQMTTDRATNGSGAINAATDAVTGMMQNNGNPYASAQNPYASQQTTVGQNQYIGQNPYLAQQVASAQGQTADAYATGTAAQTMGQFRSGGAFGGSAMQQYQDQQNQQLGNTLNNTATTMYGNDYANTQQLQQQYLNNQLSANLTDAARNAQYTQAGNELNSSNYNAAQNRILTGASTAQQLGNQQYTDAAALMNMGNVTQAQNQNEANAAYQQWYNQAMMPYQQLGILQNSLSGAMGAGPQGVTTSGSSGGGSALTGAAGGALSGAAAGSAFGPWGAAIGGVGGGLLGAFSS